MTEPEVDIQRSEVAHRIRVSLNAYRQHGINAIAIALGPTEFLSWVLIESRDIQRSTTATSCGNGCQKAEYEFEGLPLYAVDIDGIHIMTDLSGAKRMAWYKQQLMAMAPWRIYCEEEEVSK